MNQIRVYSTGQSYRTESETKLVPGQEILVEAEQILEPAIVLCENCPKREAESLAPANFIRVMTPADQAVKTKLKEKARQFVNDAQTKVMRHGLDMKIVDATLSFDEKKATFYFAAEGRVDFRALVADMVGSFCKIIRLQQIGPREETRLMGGIGRCGQELCCHRFIKDLDGISAQMAQLQETGGQKFSKNIGCCGRLMCCMSYENHEQKDIKALSKEKK